MGVVFNDPQTFCAEECKILPSDNLLAPPKNPRNHVSAERSKVQDQHSQSHFYMLTMNTQKVKFKNPTSFEITPKK